MSGAINNTDLLAAVNQNIKAVNDLCQCVSVTVNTMTNVSVGVTVEQTEGEEGGTPPEGTSAPSVITDRKCKAAEILFDDIETIVQNFRDNPLSLDLFGLLEIGVVLNPYVTEGTLFMGDILTGVWGWLVDLSVTIQLNLQLLDFDDIATQLANKKAEIICHMSNSTSPSDARDLIAWELDQAGLTAAEVAFITDTLLPNDVLHILFFTVAGSEAIIDDFTLTADCSSCCPIYTVTRGTEVDPDTWDSENTGEGTWPFHHRVSLAFGCTSDTGDCGGPKRLITINSAPGYTQTQGADIGVRISSSNCRAPNGADVYSDDDLPTGIEYCAKAIEIASETAFTLNMTIGGTCA